MNEPTATRDGWSLAQPATMAAVIATVGVALSLFQLYSAGIRPLGLFYQRPIHLGFVMVLAFLIFPVWGAGRRRGTLGWAIDLVFLVAAVMSGGYIVYYINQIAIGIDIPSCGPHRGREQVMRPDGKHQLYIVLLKDGKH